MWLNVHKRLGFVRAGLCVWDELQGWLPLPGKRFRGSTVIFNDATVEGVPINWFTNDNREEIYWPNYINQLLQ